MAILSRGRVLCLVDSNRMESSAAATNRTHQRHHAMACGPILTHADRKFVLYSIGQSTFYFEAHN